jgi:hypothetical protein
MLTPCSGDPFPTRREAGCEMSGGLVWFARKIAIRPLAVVTIAGRAGRGSDSTSSGGSAPTGIEPDSATSCVMDVEKVVASKPWTPDQLIALGPYVDSPRKGNRHV